MLKDFLKKICYNEKDKNYMKYGKKIGKQQGKALSYRLRRIRRRRK